MANILKILLVFLCLTFMFSQALANHDFYTEKLNEGKAYLSDGYPSLAIEALNSLAKEYPDKEEIYCYIGLAYAQGELYDKALYYYDKSLDINPKFWPAHLNIAKHYRAFKHYDKAIYHYRKILEYYPNEPYLQKVVSKQIEETKSEYNPEAVEEEVSKYNPVEEKQAVQPRRDFVASITEWGGNVHIELDNKTWERTYEGESDYGKFISYGLAGEDIMKLQGWTESFTVNYMPQMADTAGIDYYYQTYKLIIKKLKGGVDNIDNIENSAKEKIFEWSKDDHVGLCRLVEVGSDIYVASYENKKYPKEYDRVKWLGKLKHVKFR